MLTACQAGGVEIVVYPPSDPDAVAVDEVRIYVGDGGGQTSRLGTRALKPDPLRRGEVWARDSSEIMFDHRMLSSPDEVTSFTYAATGDGQMLSVIAVGMSGGKPTSAYGLYDLALPTDHVDRYKIGLNPATLAGNAAGTPGVTRGVTEIELWGEAPDDQTCVQLLDRGGYHDDRHPLGAITNPGDADCDGYFAGDKAECDDRFFQSSIVPGTSNLSCLVPDVVQFSGQSVSRCRAGGVRCTDGMPTTRNDCSTTPAYCTPTALCDLCPPDQKFEDCAIDPVGKDPAGDLGPIVCKVPVAKDALTGVISVCPHALSMVLPFQIPLNPTCAHPMFHGPAKSDRWEASIDVAGISYPLTTVANGACKFHAIPTMLPMSPPDLGMAFGGLFAFDLSPTLGVVLPLVITTSDTFVPQCATTPTDVMCALESPTLDAVRSCISVSGGG